MTPMRSDFPVAADSSGRFLPWLAAVMVFLGAMTLAGALSLNDAIDRWRADVSGVVTVQVPPAVDGGSAEENARRTALQVERVTRLLQSLPNVASAKAVPDDHLTALLEPWLGSRDLIAALPVPRLVDVRIVEERPFNVKTMRARLADVAPGAQIDDHRVWLSRLIDLAEGMRLLAWATLLIVSLAVIATTVYAARTALAVHRTHIEVLHLVGATDSYIARQFARRALMHGCVGGGMGLLAASPTLWLVGEMLRRLQIGLKGGLIPAVGLTPAQMTALAVLPLIAGCLSMVATRMTVRRQLARML